VLSVRGGVEVVSIDTQLAEADERVASAASAWHTPADCTFGAGCGLCRELAARATLLGTVYVPNPE
jgi:hypothetical protein